VTWPIGTPAKDLGPQFAIHQGVEASHMLRFLCLTIALTLLVTACGPKLQPQQSCNFVQNSEEQRVSWKGEVPIDIYVHESVPSNFIKPLLKAMAQWEMQTGHALFRLAGVKTGPLTPSRDGQSVIYWFKTWNQGLETEQARTTIYWVGDRIDEADMYVDGSNFTYAEADPTPAEVDFESLMVHELGHVLGYQHIVDHPSVMSPTLANGVERRTLEREDLSSFQCEYQ
jgi:hypothetical protein